MRSSKEAGRSQLTNLSLLVPPKRKLPRPHYSISEFRSLCVELDCILANGGGPGLSIGERRLQTRPVLALKKHLKGSQEISQVGHLWCPFLNILESSLPIPGYCTLCRATITHQYFSQNFASVFESQTRNSTYNEKIFNRNLCISFRFWTNI